MKFTKEQSEAIFDKNKNLLVSAAAGSGKTAVLIERIIRLIEDEEARLDELLIVTFTNAAAGEMRERILEKSPEQYKYISNANISTFHAFANEVVKRYFYLVNLSPGFKVCDQAKQTLLKEESISELLNILYEESDPCLLKLLDDYTNGRNDNQLIEMIFKTHEMIESLPERETWLKNAAYELKTFEDPDVFLKSHVMKEINDSIYLNLDKAENLSTLLVQELSHLPMIAKKAEIDRETIKNIKNAYFDSFDKGNREILSVSWQRFVLTKAEKQDYEKIREKAELIRKSYKSAIDEIKANYAMLSIEEYADEIAKTADAAIALESLVSRFDEIYKKKKAENMMLDFADLEHYALKILDNEDAAAEYKKKFKYIFIDEYQDSNLVQESLINKIKRDDNLFMVGDVKQSIYKFRLAEPEIFLKKYKDFSTKKDELNKKIDLNRNFRSQNMIIEAVNHIFKEIMTVDSTGIDYINDGMLISALDKRDEGQPVILHLMDSTNDTGDEIIDDMPKIEAEAMLAAGLLKEQYGKPIYDVKLGKTRETTWKDMVILLRSAAGAAEFYYDALKKKGIPSYIEKGDGYFDSNEILVFLNFLKILDNQCQDLPMISVLSSPIFDFSVSDIAKIRIQFRNQPYYEAFRNYSESGEDETLALRCKEVLEEIESFRQDLIGKSLDDGLWHLMQKTGYYLYLGTLRGGKERQANLRALADKAALYKENKPTGLSGYISYLDSLKTGKISTAPIKLLGEADDVVRIMTVHKSKGLEFPVVLVGNLGRQFRVGEKSHLALHRDFGIGLSLMDSEKGSYRRPLLQRAITSRFYKDDMAEEIRILYVALTRAKNKLLLLGSVANPENAVDYAIKTAGISDVQARTALDYLMPLLSKNDSFKYKIHEKSAGLDTEPAEPEIIKDKRDLVAEDTVWEYPYKEAVNLKSKFSVTEIARNRVETKKTDWTDLEIKDVNEITGQELGNLYHLVLEILPFKKEGLTEQEISAHLKSWEKAEIFSEKEIEKIDPKKISRFCSSEIGKEIATADKLYRELPFNMTYDIDGETVLVQGIIDCCYRLDGEYTLVDYKTDKIRSSSDVGRLTEIYKRQVEIYKEAFEKLQGEKLANCYLAFIDSGDIVRI